MAKNYALQGLLTGEGKAARCVRP